MLDRLRRRRLRVPHTPRREIQQHREPRRQIARTQVLLRIVDEANVQAEELIVQLRVFCDRAKPDERGKVSRQLPRSNCPEDRGKREIVGLNSDVFAKNEEGILYEQQILSAQHGHVFHAESLPPPRRRCAGKGESTSRLNLTGPANDSTDK